MNAIGKYPLYDTARPWTRVGAEREAQILRDAGVSLALVAHPNSTSELTGWVVYVHPGEFDYAGAVLWPHLHPRRWHGEDPRLTMCLPHFDRGERHKASHVVPQHRGGHVDRPAEWLPVCEDLYAHWFADTGDDDQLPSFVLPEVQP